MKLLDNRKKVTFTCQRWKLPNVAEFSVIPKTHKICHFVGVVFLPSATICTAETACSNSFRILLLLKLVGKCLRF